MKKLLILAICASSFATFALPTYEPFTESATPATATGTNAVDLALGGFTAPGGESWGSHNLSGTSGTGLKGLDIDVTNMATGSPFTTNALSSILPTNFPGYPSGSAITTFIINPEQPNGYPSANVVGNSAVLTFAHDITRPTNGTKTLYISYLFAVAQKGQTGAGNDGRYLGFLASSNLVEGTGTTGAFKTWASLFNSFNTTSNRYFGHAVFNGAPEYLEPVDSSAGLKNSSTTFSTAFNNPNFIVGEFIFTTGGAIKDTNVLWVNPAISSFGGPIPLASPTVMDVMNTVMSDVGGFVFIDRPGSGASGGVGTNYVANLIIGSTWSYVTGGPEFTTQPPASTAVNIGQNVSISGTATAAGQSVTYQWKKVTGGTTNNVTDGSGGAGGTATVSGSATSALTLTGIGTGDVGNYQLLATASSTGFNLPSTTAIVALSDPQVTSSPANAVVNYGQAASFTAQASTMNAPLHYQWYFGSTPLANGLQADGSTVSGASGVTGAGTSFTLTLTITNVSYLDDGNYTLYVTNQLNLESSSTPASLAVNDPYIITQPANQAVPAGGTANFTVAASGSPTVNYQWYESGTALSDGGTTVGGTATVSGAASPTLTLTGISDADNGSYYVTVSGGSSGQSTNSTTNTLTTVDPLVIASTPMSLNERVGDHLAFTVGVVGPLPSFQWSFNSTPIPGATNSSLVLTNIQTTNQGAYSVVVSNLVTAAQTFNATLGVINSTILPLASTNIVVARVGDGAQALSGATGNTIYLDEYTTNGVYVSTVQVPDEATGKAYGTGGATSLIGSPALLAQGAGADAVNGAMLTLSGGSQQYLNFAGYCLQYPFTGTDVTATPNASTAWRGLATLDAFGGYSLAYTNQGLYSGGNHTIRGMVTLDGTNYWTTGQAGSGGVKYVNSTTLSYAAGSGIPSSTASATGAQVVQFVNGPLNGFSSISNLVCSDSAAPGGAGLYASTGTPEPAPSGNITFTLLLNEGGVPNDFAFSPDNQTVYIADSQQFGGTNSQAGGIQRWDTNVASGGWSYSYTLQPLMGSTIGAKGLTVDFSATNVWGTGSFGARIYATTFDTSTNNLVLITDNGPASTPAVIATAGLNQALRGVRFGPAAVPVSFASQPQSQTNFPANSVTFTASANGTLPISYQWQFNGTNIPGATQSSFTTNNITFASGGNYSVVISNLVPSTATSSNAVLTVTAGAPVFTTGVQSYVEGSGDHLAFVPVVSGSLPINAQWYLNTTNNPISGATNLSLVLTNIQTGQSGTYLLYVNNIFGTNHSSGALTVTASPSTLSSNNLVVARIGDGMQALSGATGNTLYLDQYTPAGAYVNTIQVPDEGTSLPYGTGSSSSTSLPFGSPALLVAGGNTDGDAAFEAFLTLSTDGQTLDFAGYVQGYPFLGTDVSVNGTNGGANWRGVGAVDAFGSYSTVYTNSGLDSGGNHQVHSAVTLDQTNYWVTGEAGSGGLKYVTPAFEPANGGGIPGVAGSAAGTRVVQIINGNLVFSDAGASPSGIYGFSGTPNNVASPTLLITETNSPMDFASSPDLATVYIADNGTFSGAGAGAGGIQRWDTDPVNGGYTNSYTLATGNGFSTGARGLTADFSAQSVWGLGVTGAKIYATTAEFSGNRLIKIVDNGASSSATTLATAGSANTLAGVRFGPVAIPASITAEPQRQDIFVGSSASFSVGAAGSAPFYYQWQFNGTNLSGATQSSLTVSPAQAALPGNYSVIVSNLVPPAATSTPASVTFVPVLTFNGNGSGWSRNGTGGSGLPVYNYNGGSNVVELTQGVAAQGSTTFYSYPVYVGGFLATWTYQVVNPSGTVADGTAFVVQNDARGPAAVGSAGGFFDYGGTGAITNSAALEFNIFSGVASGVGYAFDTNGVIGPNTSPAPVVINDGNPINVTLQYVNGVATLTLLDTVTSDTFTTNATLDIPAAVGGVQAYVGFTAADGASFSTQTVSNFVFTSLISLSAMNTGNNSLILAWPIGVGGYTLQQNGDITTPNWQNTSSVIGVTNNMNEAVVPITSSNVFYRLVIP